MNNNRLQHRMYFFVPYNIAEIQKGIQAGHAALEYAYQYGDTQEFKDFINYDKTWIILSGGTTEDMKVSDDGIIEKAGDMQMILHSLVNQPIRFSVFREPDLNNALSAICFLVDERVWDYEKYPEPSTYLTIGNVTTPMYGREYEEMLGTRENVFLRTFLKGRKLA